MDTVLNELWALIVPIVGTIVSTIVGSEIFKSITRRLFPNANDKVLSETVTWIVYAVMIVVVALIANWLPTWLVLVLGLLASGIYSQVIKLPVKLFSNDRKREKDPPVGGGGSGPIP